MNKKEIAISLMKTIETKSTQSLPYIDIEKFIHHTIRKEDGFKGIWDFLVAAPGASKVNPVRVIEDGAYVFLHSDFDFYGPHIGFDVFRFDNGRIVEMWDGIQVKIADEGRYTMIGGETEITDLGKTASNKVLTKNFVDDVLVNGKTERIEKYIFSQEYIEHNRYFQDPINELTRAINSGLKYKAIHKVLGEGNFVLVISEGELEMQPAAFFDLFRIKDDKIVEHWDVVEPIAPKEQWKNTTGRF